MVHGTDAADTTAAGSAWRAFWDKGGFWRAVLLGALYVGVNLGTSALVPVLFPGAYDADAPLASASSAFFAYLLPLITGGVFLLVFAVSVGWLRRLFARQRIGGSGWMWLLPAVALAGNALRFGTTDYGAFASGVVVMVLGLGVLVGFAEELLCRGFFVTMLRDGGHGELVVALVSSLMFAALHMVNALSGTSVVEIVFTLVYTFAFGVTMYFTLRVTRNLTWAILLHATTDPATFLQNEHAVGGVWTSVANQSNWAVILLGLVLVWFVRGRVGGTENDPTPGRVDPPVDSR